MNKIFSLEVDFISDFEQLYVHIEFTLSMAFGASWDVAAQL